VRVLHLNDLYDPRIGSSIRQMYQLAARLRPLGVESRVASTTRQAHDAGDEEILGCRVRKIHSDYPVRWRAIVSLRNRRVLGPLRELLTEFRPDVVHAHLIHSHLSYAALDLAKEKGAAVVFTAHDVMTFCYQKLDCYHGGEAHGGLLRDYQAYWQKCIPCQRFRYYPPRNALIRDVLSNSVDVKTAVSDALRVALEANRLGPFRVVHNAIELDERPVDPTEVRAFRKRIGLDDHPAFAIAGRIHAMKGHLQAVKVLAALTKTVPDARLLVLGKVSDFEKYMLALANELGVRDRIVVTDWLEGEDLRLAYAAADVFVTPSVCLDTFGLVNVEAMNFGKPVVGTIFGGTPEVVEHGVTGYVENPFDIAAFGARVAELLLDREKRETMGAAGLRRLREKFAMPRLAHDFHAIYQEVASPRRTPEPRAAAAPS
jgi:glycosyltransferase involved in cell wall biosynthesis